MFLLCLFFCFTSTFIEGYEDNTDTLFPSNLWFL